MLRSTRQRKKQGKMLSGLRKSLAI